MTVHFAKRQIFTLPTTYSLLSASEMRFKDFIIAENKELEVTREK